MNHCNQPADRWIMRLEYRVSDQMGHDFLYVDKKTSVKVSGEKKKLGDELIDPVTKIVDDNHEI